MKVIVKRYKESDQQGSPGQEVLSRLLSRTLSRRRLETPRTLSRGWILMATAGFGLSEGRQSLQRNPGTCWHC